MCKNLNNTGGQSLHSCTKIAFEKVYNKWIILKVTLTFNRCRHGCVSITSVIRPRCLSRGHVGESAGRDRNKKKKKHERTNERIAITDSRVLYTECLKNGIHFSAPLFKARSWHDVPSMTLWYSDIGKDTSVIFALGWIVQWQGSLRVKAHSDIPTVPCRFRLWKLPLDCNGSWEIWQAELNFLSI